VLLVVVGVAAKYVMNSRPSHPLVVVSGAAGLIAGIAPTARPPEVAVGAALHWLHPCRSPRRTRSSSAAA
jgi:hypothetical protein